MPEPDRTFAVLGLFEGPDRFVEAIPKLKAKGLGRLEAYTPYPVHGIDAPLGLRKSPLGGMVLVMGIVGAATALFFEWWMSVVDYPLVTGGKALFSWQAFVPILFEVTVLFATFTAGLGMIVLLARLPLFGHPILASRSIGAITRDRFALAFESDESGRPLDVEAALSALTEVGAESVEVVARPEPLPPLSLRFLTRALVAVVLACAVAGVATYWGVKLVPVLPPIVHMSDQPRLQAQEWSSFWADGHGMRMSPPGAIARGHVPYPFAGAPDSAARLLANPLPRTPEVLARGRKLYDVSCAVCHGRLGDGVASLTAAYGAKPANLQSSAFRSAPDGRIYHAIAAGKNSMPSYAADLSEEDRWAIVHYVRVLERAQHARPEDLP